MKLTIQQVEHIAQLARLELTDEEKQRYTTELSAILSYVEKLGSLDTSDTIPTVYITEKLLKLRVDEPQPISESARAALVQQFPKTRAGFLVVPPVFLNYKE